MVRGLPLAPLGVKGGLSIPDHQRLKFQCLSVFPRQHRQVTAAFRVRWLGQATGNGERQEVPASQIEAQSMGVLQTLA